MPWDSVDKYRDEDAAERRKKSRRRFKIGGRRKIDNNQCTCTGLWMSALCAFCERQLEKGSR